MIYNLIEVPKQISKGMIVSHSAPPPCLLNGLQQPILLVFDFGNSIHHIGSQSADEPI
jgi:hypothetical protein